MSVSAAKTLLAAVLSKYRCSSMFSRPESTELRNTISSSALAVVRSLLRQYVAIVLPPMPLFS